MSIEMKKEILTSQECRFRAKAEQNIEAELSLPDYCAEIKRILKCTVIPGIHSVSRTGERVSAKGTVVIRVLYLGEKDKIDCYEKTTELSVSTNIKDLPENAVICAKAVTNYVNCRAASQRKITVNGSVCVEFSGMCMLRRELAEKISDEAVRFKTEKVKAENCICMAEKTFDIDEIVALPKQKASIGKILRQHSRVNIESKKAVSGKLLIKGETVCEIVYLPPESENKTESFTHVMPISQIIDVEGADDDMDLSVECTPSQFSVSVKDGSDEAGRLVEFALRISAYVVGCKEKEFEYISDCYGTENELEEEYSTMEVLSPLLITEKTEKVRKSVELSGAKEICDIWISDIKAVMRGEKDKAKGNCNFTACILYIDEKGIPSYTEKELEFLSEVGLKTEHESPDCLFDVTVHKAEISELNRGKADISIEAAVKIKICSVNSLRVLTKVEKSERKPESRPALTLYYCSKGEKLWDIAKRYRTSEDVVKEENGIEGDCTEKDMMLLIPCV